MSSIVATLIYYLKRPYHFFKTGLLQGARAQWRYRFPQRQLKIIAITGTDGKTTSSTLLYETLKAAGLKVGLVSTVAAYAGETAVDTGFHVTSPEPEQLYGFMRQLVDEGYEYLVLEATSHGIYQYRTWGVKPLIVGVTNVNYEHLDYHLTYEKYVAAKALLFKKAKTVVLNADDESFAKLKKYIGSNQHLRTYTTPAELPRSVRAAIKERFTQDYNQRNASLVATIADELGVPNKALIQALEQFRGVPGRMETVTNRRGLKIVIDFAHTPQAVKAVLTTLKQELKAGQKLIAVFGCAGLRDTQKRPKMGRYGAEIADLAVFTAEDPRTEDIWSILRQMKSELGEHHRKVISMADRQEAITFAIRTLAKKGDTIAILGKGHEQSMAYGHQEYPWSDRVAVDTALVATR